MSKVNNITDYNMHSLGLTLIHEQLKSICNNILVNNTVITDVLEWKCIENLFFIRNHSYYRIQSATFNSKQKYAKIFLCIHQGYKFGKVLCVSVSVSREKVRIRCNYELTEFELSWTDCINNMVKPLILLKHHFSNNINY